MKLRTSFFDKTVLKKDITRFLPVWLIYTIGAVLVAVTTGMNYASDDRFASNLNNLIGPFSVINLLYGALVAVLLFGDLFNTRLCNALHAMPLRREGWFFTHITSGLLFSAVPNLLVALACMPLLGKFWYTALLWYLGMELHYVFFFALGVLCCMCAGNWFAALTMYAIVNFLSMILKWFASTVFEPLMYGVKIGTEGFGLFSPVVQLCMEQGFFSIVHSQDCPCQPLGDVIYGMEHIYRFGSLGEGWIYLAILAAVGIALGALALVLYRKRHLESAGDFVAFRWLHPVFALIFTLCAGAVMQMLGNLFFGDGVSYVYGCIGVVVGFFVAQMLLRRTVKVFRLKNWLFAGGIVAAVALALVLCKADVLGIVSWTPEAQDVVDVKVAEGHYEKWSVYTRYAKFEDAGDIANVIDIHKLLVEEGDPNDPDYYEGTQRITICYTLRDGREVRRYYRADAEGEAYKRLYGPLIFGSTEYILGVSDLQEMRSQVTEVFANGYYVQSGNRDMLLELLFREAEAGNVSSGRALDKDCAFIVELQLKKGSMTTLFIYEEAEKLVKWVVAYSFLVDAPVEVLKDASVAVKDVSLNEAQRKAFLTAAQRDAEAGNDFLVLWAEETDGLILTLTVDDMEIIARVNPAAVHTNAWLNDFLENPDNAA